MLFRSEFLRGIRDGTITLAFRRWRRPSVRSGGSLMTPVGRLAIVSVSPIASEQISEADARSAGYASRESLLGDLRPGGEGQVFRIELGTLRPDPRVALREAASLAGVELAEVCHRLRRLDARAEDAWTLRTLAIIEEQPAVRAADLGGRLGQDIARFKSNVRKLKTLGLTESLETGYRLSPRGKAVLRALRSSPAGVVSVFPP
jgi:hypothetical protein